MKDKVFFQLVAIVALAVTVVFLFTQSLHGSGLAKIGISGGLFVVAALLSLGTGRSGSDDAEH